MRRSSPSTTGTTWRRARRLLVAASAAAVLVLLASGCAIVKLAGTGGGGLDRIHNFIYLCASGSAGTQCPERGNIGLDASTGFDQVLLGVQVPAQTITPDNLVSAAPSFVTFTPSPGYAAELQRLSPAPSGRKWVGWISPSLNYNASATGDLNAQRLYITADWRLAPAADGTPYTGAMVSTWVTGVRNVTQFAAADRPVACGSSLTTINKDVERAVTAEAGFTFCLDSQVDNTAQRIWDFGVSAAGANGSGAPGGIVSLPFTIRNGDVSQAPVPDSIPVRAATNLPGATVAVTPGQVVQPPPGGAASAVVAVGIPQGAAPGTYQVTLTADLDYLNTGSTRVGTGTVTVLPAAAGGGGAGGGGAGSGTTARRRTFTAILPRGLSAAAARTSGVPVLLGSSVAGPALVRLAQGPRRKPALQLGKRIRLRAPGPVKVTFRSAKLAKGPYRISVIVGGTTLKTVTGRLAT